MGIAERSEYTYLIQDNIKHSFRATDFIFDNVPTFFPGSAQRYDKTDIALFGAREEENISNIE